LLASHAHPANGGEQNSSSPAAPRSDRSTIAPSARAARATSHVPSMRTGATCGHSQSVGRRGRNLAGHRGLAGRRGASLVERDSWRRCAVPALDAHRRPTSCPVDCRPIVRCCAARRRPQPTAAGASR